MPRRGARPRDPFDPFDGPIDETLDLHGFSVVEARTHVPTWLAAARRRHPGGLAHLITGKGRGSSAGPVLKGVVRALLDEATGVVAESTVDHAGGGFLVRLRGR